MNYIRIYFTWLNWLIYCVKSINGQHWKYACQYYYRYTCILLLACMVLVQSCDCCDVALTFKQLKLEELNSFTSFEVSPAIEISDFQSYQGYEGMLIGRCGSYCVYLGNCSVFILNGTTCHLMSHHTCGQPNWISNGQPVWQHITQGKAADSSFLRELLSEQKVDFDFSYNKYSQ